MIQSQPNNNEKYDHRGVKNDQNAITHLSEETACVLKPPAAGLIIWCVIFDNYGGRNLWLFGGEKNIRLFMESYEIYPKYRSTALLEMYEVGSWSQCLYTDKKR